MRELVQKVVVWGCCFAVAAGVIALGYWLAIQLERLADEEGEAGPVDGGRWWERLRAWEAHGRRALAKRSIGGVIAGCVTGVLFVLMGVVFLASPAPWKFKYGVLVGSDCLCVLLWAGSYIEWKEGRRAWRKEKGRCLKCGYDLRGSEGRCPECGEVAGDQ